MKRLFSFLLALSFLATGMANAADSNENPFKINAELDQRIRAGLHELYNLNFDQAEKIFAEMKDQEAEHPMVAFGESSVYWWRMSVNVSESDPEESKKFTEAVDRCMRLSREKIKRGDPTGEGYLTLGGAEGLLGRWQAANREWMSAYFKGKDAYRDLRRSLKKNPQMMDANMGLGIFDYYIATLPAVVRVLAFIGQGGDKQKGLDELRIAGEKGTYANTPSWLFLVNIYSTLENKPAEANQILEKLIGEYPNSPFIQMLKIIALYGHGSVDELEKEATTFKERVDTKVYRDQFQTEADFAVAMVAFKKKDWIAAAAQLSDGIRVGVPKDPFTTWSYLYRGYAEDAQGRRDDAVKDYNQVLSQPRRWGSLDNAKARLDKPFTPDDIEVKKLVL